MQQLQNSKLKTERSAIDNISVNDALPSSDYSERAQQLTSIYKWLNKRSSNGSLGNAQELYLQNRQYNYFMVKIDSLSHLPFRRVHKLSKIYVHLAGSLINLTAGTPQRKYTRTIKQLQQTNASLFQLKQSTCLYFYSSNQTNFILRVQVLISQQLQLQQESDKPVSIHSPCQSLGFIEIELGKEVKAKEKKAIRHPGEINLFYRQQSNQIKGAYCTYYLVKSQSYKHLERLVKPNTLCDCTDRIPGVLGHYLPVNQNALSDFTITPEAQGLLIQFNNIEFSPLLLKDTHAKCQKYARSIYSSANNLTFSSKELLLRASFHNGWKVVSLGQTPLKQKEGNRVNTNNSFVSGLHHNKSKENISIIKQFEGGVKRNAGNSIYNAQKNIELGLTFPGQQQCMLILQINAKVTVTVEYGKEQKQVDIFKQIVQIPVCFALISAKGMSLRRFQTLKFNAGCALTSQIPVLEMVGKQLAQLQVTMNQKRSVARLQIQRDNFSAIKSIKTISNATLIGNKKIIAELGMVEFELHFRDKDPIACTPLDNLSMLIIDNISGVNTSRADLKDKINAEKERISKETKKAVQIKKKLGVQFYNQAVISQTQKEQILLTTSKASSAKKNNQRQELLLYLKHFLPELTTIQSQGSGYLRQQAKKQSIVRAHKMIYYSIKVAKGRRDLSFEPMRLPTVFYLLHSNYQFTQNHHIHLYEDTPIDIIRTELSQLNYNNLFFFNFLNILPSMYESLYKFPKTFFLKTRFWNEPEIRSQLLSINKDTGEIVLFGSQDSSKEQCAKSKIMHMEIGFDQAIQNYQISFIHFIQYLYNGLLTVEIVDYATGHAFGMLMLPLRMLIRKRRNEAIFTHQDYIYHRNQIRGKVRVEVRALRKIKQRINKKILTPDATLEQSSLTEKPEGRPAKGQQAQLKEAENKRIMERIIKFKEARTKRSSPQKSPKKGPDQEQIEDIQQQQYKKVQNLFNDKYISEKKVLKVSYLKKYFFFINIENKHDRPSTFRVAVNDQDQQWISSNPLSHGEQLTVVKDISLLEKGDRQKISSIKKYQQKMDKCYKLVHQSLVQLEPMQKGTLLLCYLSVRKYKDWSDVDQEGQLLLIYNRERTINCSLINHLNGTVEAVSSIQVIPVPDETNLQFEYYRPCKQRSIIHLPFIDPSFLEHNIDQVLIDDPYILVSPAQNSQMMAGDRKGPVSFEKGVVLQLANGIGDQQCKQVNVFVVNSVTQKQQQINQSRKQEKSRVKSRLEIMEVVSNGPPTINITLKVWGCYNFAGKIDLWQQAQVVLKLQTRLFASKMSTYCFYMFSQNEDQLKIRKNKKLKYERPELFKITKEDEIINAYCDLFSNKAGHSYINIHVVEAKSVLDQQQAALKHQFNEVPPVYRMVFCLETAYPAIKELIKININRSAQQKVIEEPFVYRSSCSKKTSYKVLTSDSSLLWVKNSDSNFQLEGKGEQKISIFFQIDQIIENSSVPGAYENVILGVKWDKGIDYFSFRFNIY